MSQLVGIFIVGVLSGWLVEWVFVRLFVPNPAAKLETALQNLRKENAVLQQQNRELQDTLKSMSAPVPVNETTTTEAVAEAVADVVDVAETASAEVETIETGAETTVATEPSTISANDDLSRLLGIGPKLAEAMNAAGVTSYAQIASMDTEALTQALAGCTVRYNKAVAKTWAAQAKLAMAGDWAGLKAYQASLKA